MVEKLNSWIQSLIVAVSITTIIEMILPEGNNKKYVKVVCSIFILFTIVSPILELTKYDFEKLNDIYKPTTQTVNAQTENIGNIYINAYEEEIQKTLIDNGFQIRNVKLTLDNDLEKINNIVIETYYISDEEQEKIKDKVKSEYEIENIIIR